MVRPSLSYFTRHRHHHSLRFKTLSGYRPAGRFSPPSARVDPSSVRTRARASASRCANRRRVYDRSFRCARGRTHASRSAHIASEIARVRTNDPALSRFTPRASRAVDARDTPWTRCEPASNRAISDQRSIARDRAFATSKPSAPGEFTREP